MADHEPPVDLGSISLLIPPSKDGDPAARERLLAEMQIYLRTIADRQMDGLLKQKVGTSMIDLRVVGEATSPFDSVCSGDSWPRPLMPTQNQSLTLH